MACMVNGCVSDNLWWDVADFAGWYGVVNVISGGVADFALYS